ncbi:HK97 family phage prohead protease [Methylobacterium sp. WSM2598]|uniref:HK97 family phage prohead protease n=1 Tax=Methylobacterium sp. WSM2598 TaxID=398261 RepID=UPI000565D2A8|nr:HK97 family phage prohead protease [Methylobacterium sp. WSM2598]
MPPTLEFRNVPTVRLAPPLEVKLDPGAKVAGSVSGYASVYGGPPDAHGDVIAVGAFRRTLAEHKASGSAPVMLWSHDQSQPIGRWTELREDGHGLFARGELNLDSSRGRDAHAHIKNGDVNGLSIGFFVAEGGRKSGERGTTILTDLDLAEISVVALPANRRARLNLTSKAELVDLLHKSGLPREAANRLAAGGWSALAGTDPDEEARHFQIAADRIARLAEKMRTGR